MSNTHPLHSGHTLPAGYKLHDNYIIDSLLGEGGFGITYSGTCLSTNMQVAIKEYFPSGMANREQNSHSFYVSHFEGRLAGSFQRGMQRFLNEANLLKEFHELGSIVPIFDVFEENGTAYLIMEYVEGITLKQLITEEGPLSYPEMLTLFKPLLLDLHEVHKKGLIHRDISPDNLIVGMDNRLHLIDFGAASFQNPNESKTMTVILKSGYAPPEQYITDGRIGAWTDVYALCATIYMVLNGQKPTDSIKRMQIDTLAFTRSDINIAPYQKNAILRGLSLNYAERFPTVKSLYQALTTPPTEDLTETMESFSLSKKKEAQIRNIGKQKTSKPSQFSIIISACIVFTLLYCGLGIYGIHVPFWPDNLTVAQLEHSRNTENSTTTSPESQQKTYASTEPLDKTTDTPTASTESLTSQILTMVNTTGTSLENARKTLTQLDSSIQVTVTEEYNSEIASGLVISQSIAANTQFTKGQIEQIQLVISKGKKPTPSTQTARTTENSDYNVKGSDDTTPQKKDGYTTIHLD